MTDPKPKIGLALGSGSARGWAHIGVLRQLQEAGIAPDIVCGTSIGSFVGAAYVCGDLDRLDDWTRGLKWQTVLGMLDLTISGGLIKGHALTEFFRSHFEDRGIEELDMPFAAVATHLNSGREVWLQSGSIVDAVRASIAFPGLLTPVAHNGHLLVDGGLVNPVPVSLCRALGADIVIAVDLNADLVGRHLRRPPEPTPLVEAAPAEPSAVTSMLSWVQSGLNLWRSGPKSSTPMPSIVDVISSSINVMQVRITRSRLAGEPADVLIQPRLGHVALMDYHRASVAIEEGRRATKEMLPQMGAYGLG